MLEGVTQVNRDEVARFAKINAYKSDLEAEFKKAFKLLILMTELAPNTQLHKSSTMDREIFLDWVRTVQTRAFIKETAYHAYEMALTALQVNYPGFNDFLG